MQLGRTHRAQIKVPIHFSPPDRSKTYIGETINISSSGFSVQVRTSDPLPTIILAGILPTSVAGDVILCKARVVWQGGPAGGIKRASFKITSIAEQSQQRLDRIIAESVNNLIAELSDLPLFEDCPTEDIEGLLSLARARDIPPDTGLYAGASAQGIGLFVILEGDVGLGEGPGDEHFGPSSTIGQWTDAAQAPSPHSAQTRTITRLLHLPASLLPEVEAELPAMAERLRGALGKPGSHPGPAPGGIRRRRMRHHPLEELQEIPTLPAIFNAVMDCAEDAEATPRDLAHIIRRDQALTVRLLKTVNSALFGFTRRIGSVDEAVVLLGMNQTVNLAVTALLLNSLVDPKHPDRRPEAFWEHSLGVAQIAQAIAEKLRGGVEISRSRAAVAVGSEEVLTENRSALRTRAPESAWAVTAAAPSLTIAAERIFTCAVVHDIGLTTMYVRFPEHFAAVQEAIAEFGNLHRAELDLLEVDHCQLGYRIAAAWRLPEPIPTIIAEHHLPELWAQEITDRGRLLDLLREDRLVTLISLADIMTRNCGIGIAFELQPPAIPEIFFEALGLSQADVDEIIAEGPVIKERVELFFGGMTD